MSPKRILVPVDFSDVTGAVIEEARQLARARRARLCLIHVCRDCHRTGGMEFELAEQVREGQARNEAHREQLARYAERLRRQGVRTEVRFAVGDARRTLLEAAREDNPLAVVIGAHARGRLYDVLSAGIRRSLLRERAWPVLVVPAARPRADRRSTT